jgi:hypothetical protein
VKLKNLPSSLSLYLIPKDVLSQLYLFEVLDPLKPLVHLDVINHLQIWVFQKLRGYKILPVQTKQLYRFFAKSKSIHIVLLQDWGWQFARSKLKDTVCSWGLAV